MPILVDGAPIRYDLLPASMRPGIERWIEHGIRPGDFLWAVITNDLLEACRRADDQNGPRLAAYVAWFALYAPPDCFGSAEAAQGWLARRAAENMLAERRGRHAD